MLAGQTYQLCWDTVDLILWVCTTSGTATSAVWTKSIMLTAGSGISISQAGNNIEISSTSFTENFVQVAGTSQAMVSDTIYQTLNVSLTTLILPTTSNLGDIIQITGKGSGGWTIAQNAGQNIQVGSISSTIGTGGSVSSTNQFDGIELVCTTANTTWQTIVGPQGLLSIV